MRETFDIDSLRRRLLPESSVLEAGKTGLPVAAVAIIIDPKKEGGSVLLIRRTERQGDPWSGQIAFPGGHKVPTDQTYLETALRETWEEVGIQLSEHDMLGVLPLVHARSRRLEVTPFVFQLRHGVSVRRNAEVAESFWAPLSELQNIAVSKSEVQVEKDRLIVECYVYRSHTVWGMTFRIINSFLGRESQFHS